MAKTLVEERPITDIIKKIKVVPTYVINLDITPYFKVHSLHLCYLGIALGKVGYFCRDVSL